MPGLIFQRDLPDETRRQVSRHYLYDRSPPTLSGFLGSAMLTGEPLQGWKLAASSLVIADLCLNLTGPRLAALMRTPAARLPSRE